MHHGGRNVLRVLEENLPAPRQGEVRVRIPRKLRTLDGRKDGYAANAMQS